MKYDKVLADTSIWFDFFKKGTSKASKDLSLLIELNLVYICGIIESEIIQGLRSNEIEKILSALDVVNYIEIERTDFKEAGFLLNRLRNSGITIPLSDAIIASCAIRNNLKVITFDTHFNYIKPLIKNIYKE